MKGQFHGILDELHGKHTAPRQPYSTPTHEPKGGPDVGLDEALSEGRLPKYMACQMVHTRKQIARRHAKRKVGRASRQRNRR